MSSQPVPTDKPAALRALRALLAEKHPAPPAPMQGGGLPVLLEEGAPPLELAHGAVVEACGPLGSGALLLERLLDAAAQVCQPAALVDGAGSLEPPEGGWFLWVRCHQAQEALRAVDLLLRDGGVPLVLLDLQMNPVEELRRIPPATWHRFQRLVEPAPVSLVVFTPWPMAGSAAVRLFLNQRFGLEALRARRLSLRLGAVRTSRHEGGRRETA